MGMKLKHLVGILVAIVTISVVGMFPARADIVPTPVVWTSFLLGHDPSLTTVIHRNDPIVDIAKQHDANVHRAIHLASDPDTGNDKRMPSFGANPDATYGYADASGFNIAVDTDEMIKLFFSTLGTQSEDDVPNGAQFDYIPPRTAGTHNVQSMSTIHDAGVSKVRYSSPDHAAIENGPSLTHLESNPYGSMTVPQYQAQFQPMHVQEAVPSRNRTEDAFLNLGFVRLNRWEFFGICVVIALGILSTKS